MHCDSYRCIHEYYFDVLCEGDIIAGDFDESDVTGDHGTWHSHLGRSFLNPGKLTCVCVCVCV